MPDVFVIINTEDDEVFIERDEDGVIYTFDTMIDADRFAQENKILSYKVESVGSLFDDDDDDADAGQADG